jgi:hypothetical protein
MNINEFSSALRITPSGKYWIPTIHIYLYLYLYLIIKYARVPWFGSSVLSKRVGFFRRSKSIFLGNPNVRPPAKRSTMVRCTIGPALSNDLARNRMMSVEQSLIRIAPGQVRLSAYITRALDRKRTTNGSAPPNRRRHGRSPRAAIAY